MADTSHRFDQIIINNRWKRKPWMRSDDWVFIGIGKKWFGHYEYEYFISLFGIDIRFWFIRTFVDSNGVNKDERY